MPVLTATRVARHSTPTLTARYSHSFKGDELAAVNALPDLTDPDLQTLRATGTCDTLPAGSSLAECLAQQDEQERTSADLGGRNTTKPGSSASAVQTGRKTVNSGSCKSSGEVSERLKEPVSKTGVVPSTTVGSNPTLSVFSSSA